MKLVAYSQQICEILMKDLFSDRVAHVVQQKETQMSKGDVNRSYL